ncbi:alpha/beta fold hydrolase [Bradyrhizobium sp. cf659]|uniref:alpha/beta fold hydrolase n=1 Tax=Bradyrhizobium sp. cf659 TaxID=1761771 RepID=UPI0032DEB9B2
MLRTPEFPVRATQTRCLASWASLCCIAGRGQSRGRSGWFSQTQPTSSQTAHFMPRICRRHEERTSTRRSIRTAAPHSDFAGIRPLPPQQKLSADKIAWRSKPSWYILATQDQPVHPDLQRWVSKRMGAIVTEVASSHVPMLSQPNVVIDVIRRAAAAVQKSRSQQA